MKIFVAIMLCLSMMLSVVSVSSFAAEETGLATPSTPTPVVDGTVNENEYSSSKLYSGFLQFQWTQTDDATITEYVSHDEEYLYLALVYDVRIFKIDLMINGSENVRYDWDSAAKYSSFTFLRIYSNVEVHFNPLFFGELDYLASAKIQDNKTVVELKISKESMMSAYGVDSVDYFGYYARAFRTPSSPDADVIEINNGTYLGNDQMQACGFANMEYDIEYEYNLGPWYNTQLWTLMNIVVLSDEVLPETPALYCPSGNYCEVEGHENRAQIFDLADLRCFGLLPAHFVAQLRTTGSPDQTDPITPENTEAIETLFTTNAPTTETTTESVSTDDIGSGCGKSIALPALAILPLLVFGVAFTVKKKET